MKTMCRHGSRNAASRMSRWTTEIHNMKSISSCWCTSCRSSTCCRNIRYKFIMKTISWDDFELVEIRVGTVVQVEDFPEARKPAYKIWVDFWSELGIKKTSSQVTELYSKDDLLGRQVLWVVNFPPKQVGNFMSEFLLTGVYTSEGIVLASLERRVENGVKLL